MNQEPVLGNIEDFIPPPPIDESFEDAVVLVNQSEASIEEGAALLGEESEGE